MRPTLVGLKIAGRLRSFRFALQDDLLHCRREQARIVAHKIDVGVGRRA
jgi:hypothetical protein